MKPPNGTYTLSNVPGLSMKVTITDAGMETPYGFLEWLVAPPPGGFVRELPAEPVFAIRFPVDAEHYEAVYGQDNYTGPMKPA